MSKIIRLFNIAIYYHGEYLWGKVVEYLHTPSVFHISFEEHSDFEIQKEIILVTKNGKLVLDENSGQVNDEILKLIIAEIEENFRQHSML